MGGPTEPKKRKFKLFWVVVPVCVVLMLVGALMWLSRANISKTLPNLSSKGLDSYENSVKQNQETAFSKMINTYENGVLESTFSVYDSDAMSFADGKGIQVVDASVSEVGSLNGATHLVYGTLLEISSSKLILDVGDSRVLKILDMSTIVNISSDEEISLSFLRKFVGSKVVVGIVVDASGHLVVVSFGKVGQKVYE
jgi:hypothetical protein